MNTFSRDLRLIVLLGYPYDCVTFAKITQKIHPTLKLIIFKKKRTWWNHKNSRISVIRACKSNVLLDNDFAPFVDIDTTLWISDFHAHKIVVGVGGICINDMFLDSSGVYTLKRGDEIG